MEYQSVGRDITKRKMAEDALRNSEQLSRGIINHLPDATFVVNKQGEVIVWNLAMEEMTGVPASEMIGKNNHEYAIPFYGKRQPILIDLVFRDHEEIRSRYTYIRGDRKNFIAETRSASPQGKRVVLWAKASPLYDQDGGICGAVESTRDITDFKPPG